MKSTEHRAAAYLAKMPPAVAGNGGHAATFTAACRLVEFGLSFEQAAPVFAAWNESHCDPRWTEPELHHKLADAFKRTLPKPHLASGAAARAQRPIPAMSARRPSNQNASKAILGSRFPAKCVRPGENTPPAEIQTLAAKLRDGTSEDFAALAALRGLSIAGVALASSRGLLRFGNYHGRAAWFVLDASRRNACARRMDGMPWLDDGAKSFILRGSQAAWPLGIGEAQNFSNVLLCEGAPDLLAAFHFIVAHGRVTDCAPVTILSAAYKIPADALPMFARKRVRIFAHDDESGYRAASRWTAQLTSHALAVDAFAFAGICDRAGDSVKDLNGFAHAQANDETEKLQANLIP